MTPTLAPDLGTHLEQVLGGDPQLIEVTEELIFSWNTFELERKRSHFDARLVVGILLNRTQPARGVMAWREERAAELGRSVSWCRETQSVAGTITDAMDRGVLLPLELRELSWRDAPKGVANVEAGRPLDYAPPPAPKPPPAPLPERLTESADEGVQEALAHDDPEVGLEALARMAASVWEGLVEQLRRNPELNRPEVWDGLEQATGIPAERLHRLVDDAGDPTAARNVPDAEALVDGEATLDADLPDEALDADLPDEALDAEPPADAHRAPEAPPADAFDPAGPWPVEARDLVKRLAERSATTAELAAATGMSPGLVDALLSEVGWPEDPGGGWAARRSVSDRSLMQRIRERLGRRGRPPS